MTPQVNSNGTDRRELIDQRKAATRALNEALKAMAGAVPNGRDYSPGDFGQAVADHTARMDAVRSALAEITAEIMDLMR